MATEPNLRALFHEGTAGEPADRGIDTASVIRRARLRRLPAQAGIGGAFALAIGGLGVAGWQGLTAVSPASSIAGSAASETPTTQQGPRQPGQSSPDDSVLGASEGGTAGIKRAPADRINLCGGTLAEVAPSGTGLSLTVAFPDVPVGAASVAGTATLTNTGTQTVTGYTAATPAITLSKGGIVLWHSNGPTIQMVRDVSLAPGESLEFAASLTPVVCGVEDDTADAFRTDLPAAPAGDYQVSAAADVMVGDSLELVTGPAQTLRIG